MIAEDRAVKSTRERVRRAARTGNLVALAVVAHEAELGQHATAWIYRDYGDDLAAMEFVMRQLL